MENLVQEEEYSDTEIWHVCKKCNAKAYIDPSKLAKHQEDYHGPNEKVERELENVDDSGVIDCDNQMSDCSTTVDDDDNDVAEIAFLPDYNSCFDEKQDVVDSPSRSLNRLVPNAIMKPSQSVHDNHGRLISVPLRIRTVPDSMIDDLTEGGLDNESQKSNSGRSKLKLKYSCDKCQKNFRRRIRLLQHIHYFHVPKLFKCVCGRPCATKRGLLKHQLSCKGQLIAVRGQKQTWLDKTQTSANDRKAVIDKCDVCEMNSSDCTCKKSTHVDGKDSSIVNRRSLRQRVTPTMIAVQHHKPVEREHEISKQSNETIEPKVAAYSCKKCNKSFPQSSYLKMHCKLKHGGAVVTCVCGRLFSAQLYLDMHLRVCKTFHQNKIEQSTPLSKTELKRQTEIMTSHVEIHQNSLKTKRNLRRVNSTQINYFIPNRFYCLYCPKSYTVRYNLNLHTMKHHPTYLYTKSDNKRAANR